MDDLGIGIVKDRPRRIYPMAFVKTKSRDGQSDNEEDLRL